MEPSRKRNHVASDGGTASSNKQKEKPPPEGAPKKIKQATNKGEGRNQQKSATKIKKPDSGYTLFFRHQKRMLKDAKESIADICEREVPSKGPSDRKLTVGSKALVKVVSNRWNNLQIMERLAWDTKAREQADEAEEKAKAEVIPTSHHETHDQQINSVVDRHDSFSSPPASALFSDGEERKPAAITLVENTATRQNLNEVSGQTIANHAPDQLFPHQMAQQEIPNRESFRIVLATLATMDPRFLEKILAIPIQTLEFLVAVKKALDAKESQNDVAGQSAAFTAQPQHQASSILPATQAQEPLSSLITNELITQILHQRTTNECDAASLSARTVLPVTTSQPFDIMNHASALPSHVLAAVRELYNRQYHPGFPTATSQSATASAAAAFPSQWPGQPSTNGPSTDPLLARTLAALAQAPNSHNNESSANLDAIIASLLQQGKQN